MPTEDFFDKRSKQSEKKSEIVTKYFEGWSHIISSTLKKGNKSRDIGYVDLYAGPGRYADTSPSTPLAILDLAVSKPDLMLNLWMWFNEFNEENPELFACLQKEVSTFRNVKMLKHTPSVTNRPVESIDAREILALANARPTLFFFDPFGYKGLTQEVIRAAISGFGCDCLFFFNYRRIRAAIHNQQVIPHMRLLFGAKRLEQLQHDHSNARGSAARRDVIVEHVMGAAKDAGAKFVHPFLFFDDGEKASHYLLLASTHVRALELFKDITYKMGTESAGGVPSYAYFPTVEERGQTGLFADDNRGIVELGEMLLKQFAGRTVTSDQIYDEHHIGRPYVRSNYRAALELLETAGRISVVPSMQQRAKGVRITYGQNVEITFP